jgi:hypothetical protein
VNLIETTRLLLEPLETSRLEAAEHLQRHAAAIALVGGQVLGPDRVKDADDDRPGDRDQCRDHVGNRGSLALLSDLQRELHVLHLEGQLLRVWLHAATLTRKVGGIAMPTRA